VPPDLRPDAHERDPRRVAPRLAAGDPVLRAGVPRVRALVVASRAPRADHRRSASSGIADGPVNPRGASRSRARDARPSRSRHAPSLGCGDSGPVPARGGKAGERWAHVTRRRFDRALARRSHPGEGPVAGDVQDPGPGPGRLRRDLPRPRRGGLRGVRRPVRRGRRARAPRGARGGVPGDQRRPAARAEHGDRAPRAPAAGGGGARRAAPHAAAAPGRDEDRRRRAGPLRGGVASAEADGRRATDPHARAVVPRRARAGARGGRGVRPDLGSALGGRGVCRPAGPGATRRSRGGERAPDARRRAAGAPLRRASQEPRAGPGAPTHGGRPAAGGPERHRRTRGGVPPAPRAGPVRGGGPRRRAPLRLPSGAPVGVWINWPVDFL